MGAQAHWSCVLAQVWIERWIESEMHLTHKDSSHFLLDIREREGGRESALVQIKRQAGRCII